ADPSRSSHERDISGCRVLKVTLPSVATSAERSVLFSRLGSGTRDWRVVHAYDAYRGYLFSWVPQVLCEPGLCSGLVPILVLYRRGLCRLS
ncbi:hypothetical protein Taro_027540, partial [Colocasia esculenta]|nr:hypothetical protein [Colocasia esculenta]